MPIQKRRSDKKKSFFTENRNVALIAGVSIIAMGIALFTLRPGEQEQVRSDPCVDFARINVSIEDCQTASPRFYRFDFVPANNIVPGQRAESSEHTVPSNIDAVVRLEQDGGRDINMRIRPQGEEEWGPWFGSRSVVRIQAGDRLQLAMNSPREGEATANGRIVTVQGRSLVSQWPVRTARAQESERLEFNNVNIQEPDFEITSDPVEAMFTRDIEIAVISSNQETRMQILNANLEPISEWLIPNQEANVSPGNFIRLRTTSPSSFGSDTVVQVQRIEDSRSIGEWRVGYKDQFNWRTGNWSSCPTPVVSQWGEWSQCSESCGGGIQTRRRTCQIPLDRMQTRSVECVDANGAQVEEEFCQAQEVPVLEQECNLMCRDELRETRSCNTQACEGYSWVADDWGACRGSALAGWGPWSACSANEGAGTQTRSRICEGGGTRTRTIRCVDSSGNNVSPTLCQDEPPARREECDECDGNLEQTRACFGATSGNGDTGFETNRDSPFGTGGGSNTSSGSGGIGGGGGGLLPVNDDDDIENDSVNVTPGIPGSDTDNNDNGSLPPARIMSPNDLCILALNRLDIDPTGPFNLNAPNCSVHARDRINLTGIQNLSVGDICAGSEFLRSDNVNISSSGDFICQPIANPFSQIIPQFDVFSMTPRAGVTNASGTDIQGITLEPGIYDSAVNLTGRWDVTLNPGVYVFRNGFSVSGAEARVTGNDVSIYMEDNSNFNINASVSRVNLSAPTSGNFGELLLQNIGNGNVTIRNTTTSSSVFGMIHSPNGNVNIDIAGTNTGFETRIIGRNISITPNNASWSIEPSSGAISN